MKKSKKYFIFPTAFESGAFRRIVTLRGSDDHQVLHCGVGWSASENFLQHFTVLPKTILLCGFCGLLANKKQETSIFTVSTENVIPCFSQTFSELDEVFSPLAFKDSSQDMTFLWSREVLDLCAKKEALSRFPRACFVEMEFYPFWRWASEKDRCFRMIRIPSDSLQHDLPLPARYWLDPDSGQPSAGRILRGILRYPQRIPAMGRFIKRSFAARENLAQHLLAHYI